MPEVLPAAAAPEPERRGAELCITNRDRLGGAKVLVDGVADTTGERCVHKASEDSVRFQVFCAAEPPTKKKVAAAAPSSQPWVTVVQQEDSTSVICDPGTRPCHCHLPNKPEEL